MAHYLVRARLKVGIANDLRQRISNEEFLSMRPFGKSLTRSMNGLRHDPNTDEVLWEEEDYCSPPLAMERAAVLDKYFEDIRVESLPAGEGWERISDLPALWDDIHKP